jgi:cytochrome b561
MFLHYLCFVGNFDPQNTMYSTVLSLHSLIRWFVLAGLLFAIFRAYSGWLLKKRFSRLDNSVRRWTTAATHIQLVFGLWLYFISPIIDYFLHNYKDAVHEREIRFFGMEHSFMMITAIVIITIGSAKAKRKKTDNEKFKTMAIWFTVGLLIILTSVPWAFSPLTSRPYFRSF